MDSIVGEKAFLHITLAQLPSISQINYNGVKKQEREDLETKLGLVKESQLAPNTIDRAKILAKRYFDDKGFGNAEINIVYRDDVSQPGKVIVDVNIDKKDKVKVKAREVAKKMNVTPSTFSKSIKKVNEYVVEYVKEIMKRRGIR